MHVFALWLIAAAVVVALKSQSVPLVGVNSALCDFHLTAATWYLLFGALGIVYYAASVVSNAMGGSSHTHDITDDNDLTEVANTAT